MGKKDAVIISYYRWWDNRQSFFAEWLENKGYSLKYLSADYDHIQKDYCDIEQIPDYTKKIHVPSYNTNISLSRIYSNYVFEKQVTKYLLRDKPQVVICLIPSNLLGLALYKYKRNNPNAIIIVDVLDLWPESLPIDSRIKKVLTLPFSVWKNYRAKALKSASLILLECDYYRSIIGSYLDKSYVKTLYLQKSNGYTYPIKNLDDSICFVYIGSINSLIDIDRIVKILSRVNKYRRVIVKIIGCGSGEELFVESLEKNGIETIFYGAVFNNEEKHAIYETCHFGLNIMKPTVAVGLTTKSMDYLESGIPLLNSIPHDTSILINKYKAGFDLTVDDDDNVIKSLINLDNSDYQSMVKGASELFNNEFTTSVFKERLNNYLNSVI